LVPGLARDYFLTPVSRRPFGLSPVQAAILLSLGLQHRMIEDLEKELKLPVSQLLAMFIKCIRKFSALHREAKLDALDKDAEEGEGALAENVMSMPSTGAKRSLEEEWDPTEQGLDEDLEEAADEATSRLRAKQRELINSLDLDKYKIAGTEEDWNKEIKKKAKNLNGSVLNIAGAGVEAKEGKKQKSVAKEVMAEGKKLSAKKGKTLKR
jgi:N-acetyltransferase 10